MTTQLPTIETQNSHHDLLTVREVAQELRLDASTIRRMIKLGDIPAIALPHRGKRIVYRIRRQTLDTLLIERNCTQ